MDNDKNKEIKNWDGLTIGLLIFSILLIIFSFFTPYIFTRFTNNENLDFTQTGPIGDTIGGIMNPFIALVGIFITFLAFYMQIKANKIQLKIFKDGLAIEKQKEFDRTKREHINRLKVFKALLNSILSFYKTNGKSLSKFIEEEKNNPLLPNIFNSSTSSGYHNFLKLDLLETYNSLVYYFQDKEIDWEKDFIQLLDYLDFYDKMIKELREKYQTHINKKVTILNEQGEELNFVMNDILTDNDLKDLPENEVYNYLTNDEVNFVTLQNSFIIPIINKILAYYRETNDPKYKILLDKLSSINKKIGGEKFQTIHYVANLESTFNSYFKDDNAFFNKITDFNKLIDTTLI